MSDEGIVGAARKLCAAWRELRDGDGRGAALSLALEELDAALRSRDEADTLAALTTSRAPSVRAGGRT
ncbi:MAG: hypothetical protein K8E66_04325 [Phycisphaerales bacterium]|nr:hypothetical protein [Phycisphaerales bacterium]